MMIQEASQQVYGDPWLMVPTGVVLALTVVAANELADAIAGKTTAVGRAGPCAVTARPRRWGDSAALPADPEAVLEVRDLSVSVDDGPALVTDVSFALRPGRVLGLVGESGCGKTMTARSLLGAAARRRRGVRRLDPLAAARRSSGPFGVLATLATTLPYAALWLLLSKHLPHRDATWQALLPGAVLFGFGIEVLHLVTVYFIAPFAGNKQGTYGALGLAAALLLELFLLHQARSCDGGPERHALGAALTRRRCGSREVGGLVEVQVEAAALSAA